MKNIIICLMFISSFVHLTFGEQVLTYESYIRKVEENLPELRKYQVEVEKAENLIYGAKANEDYRISSKFNTLREVGYQNYSKLSGVNISSKVSRKFKEYGTSVYSSFSYLGSSIEKDERRVTSIKDNQPIYGTNTYSKGRYHPELEIGFIQPLWHNAKGIIDKFPLRKAKLNYELEKLRKKVSQRNDINYYKKLYFDWIAKKKMLELMREGLKNVKQIKELVEEKYNSGLVDKDELERANSLVINYEKRVLNYKMKLDLTEKELGVIIDLEGYKPDYQEFENFFTQACSLCGNKETFVSFDNTQSYKVIKKTLQKLELIKEVSNHRSQPELNLTGNIALKSQEDKFLNSLTALNDFDYRLGLSYNFPIGNHKAKSEYIDAKLSIKKLNHVLDESRNDYRKRLKSILEQIESKSQMMSYINKNVKTLRSEYKTEKKKYERARLDLQFLLNTENKITDEKRNRISTKNVIINLYLNYINLTK